jgi:hypothetical protein
LILPNSNSWNTSLLRELFYDFDVDTILKIKLPGYEVEDCVAWHYENNGCFTVKSAYRLAMSLKQQNRGNESSSSQLNGDRPIWKTIWKASVPPKVRVFGWRVATNSLATKENKCRRTLEVNNICSVCGNGTEDAHHATVSCTKAKALRHALREVWDLPGEKKFSCTGNDWLQVLLSHEDERMRARILLLLWRSWHLRNDVIHHEGKETVTSSVAFLLSYQRDTNQTNPYIGDTKGKCELNPNKKGPLQLNENPKTWNAPPVGWIKLNTDGSLPTNSNVGGAGAVARDSMGRVIFAACAPLPDCTDIEEAEARAAMLGLSILSRQGPVRVILEMDNTTIVSALRSESQDRSRRWTVY